VVVGVAGGIAAYKAAELVRLLDKAGAIVDVAMTPRAQHFITPMTFQALTRRPVFTDLCARLAAGMADDAVAAIALATRAPVLLAPSMNVNMWNHVLTQRNLATLRDVARYQIVAPGDGFLACGWTGPGRLAEPADIAEAAAHVLSAQDLAGVKVVVTAGPTYEPIDPVRFVGNRSSGKMGAAIAAAAQRRGAEVRLIFGPSGVAPPIGVQTSHVESAAQLQWALDNAVKDADVVVMTAAVADYRPAKVADHKIKRGATGKSMQIDLVANPDLLATLGAKRKGNTPLLVGFAAETDNVIENAQAKLVTKGADLIVANDVSEPGSGFAVDTNHVQLVDKAGVTDVPAGAKAEVAHRILDKIVELRSVKAVPAKKAGTAKKKRR
jgi:phosphopantothenoylcysteine decarboxylase/phosphopantothenate--cysteine ligase